MSAAFPWEMANCWRLSVATAQNPPLRPALVSSPPLCPPHRSIRYNPTISSSTKNFCFCQSTYYILLHSSVFILIYSTNIYQMFYYTQAYHSMQGEYRNDKRQTSSHLLRSLCSSVFIILQWAVNSSLERALSADLSSLLLLLLSSQFKPLWLYLSLLENSILVTYPKILLLLHRIPHYRSTSNKFVPILSFSYSENWITSYCLQN